MPHFESPSSLKARTRHLTVLGNLCFGTSKMGGRTSDTERLLIEALGVRRLSQARRPTTYRTNHVQLQH